MFGLDRKQGHEKATSRVRFHYLTMLLLAGWITAQAPQTCFALTPTSTPAGRAVFPIALNYRQQIEERIEMPVLTLFRLSSLPFSRPLPLTGEQEMNPVFSLASPDSLYKLMSLQR
jgi:hypothetical protein